MEIIKIENPKWRTENSEQQAQELSRRYSISFFQKRKKLIGRAAILCPLLIQVFPFAFKTTKIQNPENFLNFKGYSIKQKVNIIDVGCGGGEFLTYLSAKEFVTVGVEGTFNAVAGIDSMDYLVITDIAQPEAFVGLIRPKTCKLAICLEVGEHIEEVNAINLVRNLVTVSDIILFSAAQPGQGGHFHVNCKPLEYWQDLFTGYNYVLHEDKTKEFKEALAPFAKRKGLNAFYANSMVFCSC